MERFLVVAPALRLRHEQQEGVRGDSRAVVLNLSVVTPLGLNRLFTVQFITVEKLQLRSSTE